MENKDKASITNSLEIRAFLPRDRKAIQNVRRRAFQGIFESFRDIVGEEIFRLECSDWDQKQADYLDSICEKDSDKEVYVLIERERPIGFIGLSANQESATGEIDLNAIDPDYQGKGAGQFMYAFAIARIKEKSAKVVKVSTGGDSSHIPARKAYENAGFKVGIPSVTLYQRL